jgi:hypothetical protein
VATDLSPGRARLSADRGLLRKSAAGQQLSPESSGAWAAKKIAAHLCAFRFKAAPARHSGRWPECGPNQMQPLVARIDLIDDDETTQRRFVLV